VTYVYVRGDDLIVQARLYNGYSETKDGIYVNRLELYDYNNNNKLFAASDFYLMPDEQYTLESGEDAYINFTFEPGTYDEDVEYMSAVYWVYTVSNNV